jgi:DNA polymerase III delta subunit
MDAIEFENQITSPQRKSFYLVVGGDPHAFRSCLEAARKAVSPSHFQFNFRQYYNEDVNKTGWDRLKMEAAANPFGTPPRVIVIKVNEEEKLSSEAQGILNEIKNKKNRQVTVVVASESPPDLRFKFFKEVAKEGLEVDCRAPVKGALISWLIKQFSVKGCRISTDGAKAMINRIGSHPGLLYSEVEKLSIYPGPKVTFGPKQIQELVPFGPTAEIYELGMPVGSGNLYEAAPILLELLENIDSLPLMYSLDTHFRRLMHLKSILAIQSAPASNSELASQLGASVFLVPRLLEQTKAWSLESLKAALAAI